jgi:hypothetical protein
MAPWKPSVEALALGSVVVEPAAWGLAVGVEGPLFDHRSVVSDDGGHIVVDVGQQPAPGASGVGGIGRPVDHPVGLLGQRVARGVAGVAH